MGDYYLLKIAVCMCELCNVIFPMVFYYYTHILTSPHYDNNMTPITSIRKNTVHVMICSKLGENQLNVFRVVAIFLIISKFIDDFQPQIFETVNNIDKLCTEVCQLFFSRIVGPTKLYLQHCRSRIHKYSLVVHKHLDFLRCRGRQTTSGCWRHQLPGRHEPCSR